MNFYLKEEIKNPKTKILEIERKSGLKEMIQRRSESMGLGFEVDLSGMEKMEYLE